jgi:hypothetical protein
MSSTTLSNAKPLLRTADADARAQAWNEFLAAIPAVIFWRALSDVLRQRKHKRLVLDAFRR